MLLGKWSYGEQAKLYVWRVNDYLLTHDWMSMSFISVNNQTAAETVFLSPCRSRAGDGNNVRVARARLGLMALPQR